MNCACGCGQTGHDLHHCLIGRRKGFPELNAPENLILVNHLEHISRKFDNLEWRRKFWKIQCDRYGEQHMKQWVASLPDKLRHRLDFMTER
jgi:hypothetical protein